MMISVVTPTSHAYHAISVGHRNIQEALAWSVNWFGQASRFGFAGCSLYIVQDEIAVFFVNKRGWEPGNLPVLKKYVSIDRSTTKINNVNNQSHC